MILTAELFLAGEQIFGGGTWQQLGHYRLKNDFDDSIVYCVGHMLSK
jgi:hypothetical protein